MRFKARGHYQGLHENESYPSGVFSMWGAVRPGCRDGVGKGRLHTSLGSLFSKQLRSRLTLEHRYFLRVQSTAQHDHHQPVPGLRGHVRALRSLCFDLQPGLRHSPHRPCGLRR